MPELADGTGLSQKEIYILSGNCSCSIAHIGLQFLTLSLIEVQEWSWLG
jgi:hypothetical protein